MGVPIRRMVAWVGLGRPTARGRAVEVGSDLPRCRGSRIAEFFWIARMAGMTAGGDAKHAASSIEASPGDGGSVLIMTSQTELSITTPQLDTLEWRQRCRPS